MRIAIAVVLELAACIRPSSQEANAMNARAQLDAFAAWQRNHPAAREMSQRQVTVKLGHGELPSWYPAGFAPAEVVAVRGLEPNELVVRELASGELAFIADPASSYRFFREPAAALDGRVLVVRIVARGVEPEFCGALPPPPAPPLSRYYPTPGPPRGFRATAFGTSLVTNLRFYVVEYRWTNSRRSCGDLPP
jgi:hypothetical protein